MSNSKIDFITDILAQKNLEPSMKEKILSLTALELKKIENSDDTILKQIEELKKRVDIIELPIKTEGSIQKENLLVGSNFTKYLNPKYLSNFLLEYNQNRILKYTCHEIDDLELFFETIGSNSFIYEKYVDYIQSEYKKLSSKYFNKINKNITGIFWGFINGPKKWSSDNISINWSSNDLKDWCKSNPGLIPNPGINLRRKFKYDGFEFKAFITKSTNINIASFSKLVNHFKCMFHVRNDNSLKSIIIRRNQIEKFDDLVVFEFNVPENIEFFTDIDTLSQAYSKIIKMCIEFSEKNTKEKPIIKISLFENIDSITFSIHHVNSIYGKTPKSAIRPGEKETDLITKQINGLCNFILNADFGNENWAQINLWDGKERECTPLNKFVGVEFQLIF